MKRLQARIGAPLRFVFRNFPLAQMHEHAMAAAEIAEAAAFQGKFWEMHDLLFERQSALSGADLAKYIAKVGLDGAEVERSRAQAAHRVQQDFASGVRSGVNGTPTFFINGSRFDGDWNDEESFASALLAPLEAD